MSAPLADSDPYAAALKRQLPRRPPEEYPGLHNVFRLSDRVISGSEPHGDAAFARLAKLGVKTILSVDGKAPDRASAERHGLRYVHVPIQYRGWSEDELVRIVKTFRELEPPFYVHCFHGRHRGPAAAALGRLVLDGVSREQALAEMRQWCGTSGQYRGLYHAVATRRLPTPAASAAYDWDFPARHVLAGFRHAMIDIVRAADHLRDLSSRGWRADLAHPDVEAQNEADQLAGLFEQVLELDEVKRKPPDFRRRAQTAARASRTLHRLLGELKAGDRTVLPEVEASHQKLRSSCTACHRIYRNN